MPPLLRRDSIRFFEASINSLNLAIIGLSLPIRAEPREKTSLYAAEIGLIGTAAEQAVNACICQTHGVKWLLTFDKKFKPASQIFDQFSNILKKPTVTSSFLTQGILEKQNHLKTLLDKTTKFRLLAKARAGGLHAGIGPSREVTVALARDVSDFLIHLSYSSRIRPYLNHIPKPHDIVRDRAILIEELANKIKDTQNFQDRAVLISSAFLILPEISDVQPEWIDAFERVSISPNSNDVVLLLDALKQAIPSSLIRATGTGDALPVRIDSKNPSAFIVSPQFIKREFNQINEQWYADIANANGRLKNNILDLSPQDFILDVFGLGLENMNILEFQTGLPAQQTWPFVASSLSVNGTPYPYWFLVRETANLPELKSFLIKAGAIGNGYLRKNSKEFFDGTLSILESKPLQTSENSWVREILVLSTQIENRRGKLQSLYEQSKLTDDKSILHIIEMLLNDEIDISETINQLCKLPDANKSQRKTWMNVLIGCCYEIEDIPGLLYAFKNEDFYNSRSSIRRGLRIIDFLVYGPQFL
ncbi:hypothetical protein MKX42_30290 [Paenibacillus sp. FSL R7-0204]|uniref:hypothetical protein n=1 Tax=Paenibacillus sp. FSL R7-0204 TaxID=2921675 RepID=UPI0030F530E0